MIINTSRGSIVDETALLEAIESKNLRVGVDVYRDEPSAGDARFDSELAKHPAVYGTHHIGASTEQAQTAIADAVLATLESFQHGQPLNCVNLGDGDGEAATVTVRHLNRLGVLAGILTTLREVGLNVENMANFILSGGEAASAADPRHRAHPARNDYAFGDGRQRNRGFREQAMTGRALVRPTKLFIPTSDYAPRVAVVPRGSVPAGYWRDLEATNPFSFDLVMRDIIPSEGNEPDLATPVGRDRLAMMIERGIYEYHDEPAYYVYRVSDGLHIQTGIVAEVEADAYDRGLIKRHEHTHPSSEESLVAALKRIQANSYPMCLTYKHAGDQRVDRSSGCRCAASRFPRQGRCTADGMEGRFPRRSR